MREVALRISLRSPTLLSSAPPASNQLETLRFIPGNTVRGVLARRYLDQRGDPADLEFRRLFVTGEVCYGFGFAQGSEVMPLSARSCKYDSGFREDGGHGVTDLLLPATGEGSCLVPECASPLDYVQGFWRPGERREILVKTSLLTRTAIDPVRGTARSGQLFSQRALSEGQEFLSTIEAPDDLASLVEALLEKGFQAALGTGGSRGQGWAEVGRATAAPEERGSARDRYERFAAVAGRPVLAVTLLADGLFRDDYLREATVPALRDLEPLGIQPEDWIEPPQRAFMDLRRIFGFDGAPLRLPRPHRIAVAAGSAFLYEAKPGREPKIPAGAGAGWIGDVNGEGYGRAVLWHPFHLAPEGAGS